MSDQYDVELSEQHVILRNTVRKFADKEIAPHVDKDENEHRWQRDLVDKMAELGLFGCPVPEEYGGNDMGYLAHAIVTEEIGRVSGSLRVAFNMQTMGTAMSILKWGSEALKRKYIPALVSAQMIGCFGITEPDTGSDTVAMATTAVKDGDHYILNGQKMWITWSPVADMAVIFAMTNKAAKHKGMSAFVMDMDSPGVKTAPIKDKLGLWACPTGEIIMEDVRVPAGNLLGEEGRGFEYLMKELISTRLSAAAGAVGTCQAAVDEAVKYANERKQFGVPIAEFQMVQETIARMVVETEAARALTWRCAIQKDRGMVNNMRETVLAKFYASRAADEVPNLGLDVLSAYGYSNEYPMARILRDGKVYKILEGATNIMKMIIAADALGIKKANR
ncbi:MAG: acyl-CoA dehydrogenase family protein [Desulfobacterales bacterium]|jgi:glutaryl-CoA dehydrogenase (non-decarboxylating)|nr:acyl-CoA dehydrogenase family protein [Desulfobacterales bacterium]